MEALPPAMAAPTSTTTPGGPPPPRTKSKAYQTTIAAEADDLKYESKYKELKKKVKEVEEDNEQLYVKILQAQQSIQRLRLERALIYEKLATLPLPPAEATQPVARTEDIQGQHHSQHHHGPTSTSHHSSGANSATHTPHPLSQSFTPSNISQRESHANGPSSTIPHPLSSNPISAPITPTNHSRERELFQPQYSPSVRSGQDRALPPMKDVPDRHRTLNPLPPISPAHPKDSKVYLPQPTSSSTSSVQPMESGERESARRRHSPGSYAPYYADSNNPPFPPPSQHVPSRRHESSTHSKPQHSLEDSRPSQPYPPTTGLPLAPDRRPSIGHLRHLESAGRGRMEVDDLGPEMKYDARRA